MHHRVEARVATVAAAFATLALAGCAAFSSASSESAMTPATNGSPAAPATATPDGPPATPPLVGTTWHWLWTLDPERTWTRQDHSRYTLALGADGRLALRADCNRGFAGYRLDGLRLDIQPIGTTKMACPAGSLGDRFVQQVQGSRLAVAVVGLLRIDLYADSGTMWFAAEPDARHAGYACADGRNALAVYTSNRARLVVGPDTLDLRADVSASGARYTDGTTEWFTKGDEATLLRDGRPVLSGCRREEPAA